MKNYELSGDDFILRNFDRLPAFTSFLPGLAGVKGVPLWTFFVNRGQGLTSFGINNKDNQIMEFFPANLAYQNTALKGFRTFIKLGGMVYEAFAPLPCEDAAITRTMSIKSNSFSIMEENTNLGIRLSVHYFLIPYDNFGALVRDVKLENISCSDMDIEMLDGMPQLIPFGVAGSAFKAMSNLMKAWAEVTNIQRGVPIFTSRSSTQDSAEVSEVDGGYFYLSFDERGIVPPIYDPDAVFGADASLLFPTVFSRASVTAIAEGRQCFANKIPCAFTPLSLLLRAGKSKSLHTYIGFTETVDALNEQLPRIAREDYCAKKSAEADLIADGFTEDIFTKTALPTFDSYLRQSYLDNLLRGGYPFVFGAQKNKSVVHLFSRKHGDPERDYNFFSIAGEHYSQGNGNFRDVCQNRRSDVFFNPAVGDYNIKTFYSLIQADGYNPLEIRGSTFAARNAERLEAFIHDTVDANFSDRVLALCKNNFTPGQLMNFITAKKIPLNVDDESFLSGVLTLCEQHIEAVFSEGYWSDHFDYNLDLVENYLCVFPDKKEELLFGNKSYRFFSSPVRVLPRDRKYVLTPKGPRQYNATAPDLQKENYKKGQSNWLTEKNGEVCETTLYVKLLLLAVTKFATLDPCGMGLEMEGGNPGWNDAMNGLPGLFGSGMSETYELKRLINFLVSIKEDVCVCIPNELAEFILELQNLLTAKNNDELTQFEYWDKVASAREKYRAKTNCGFSGWMSFSTGELWKLLILFLAKLSEGIATAEALGGGIPHSYFTYEATQYELLFDGAGEQLSSGNHLPLVRVTEFTQKALPHFLEAPAKLLRTADKEHAKHVYNAVRASEIFDKKLGMYKTSVPLDEISIENGRIRAFTAGWLERESVFLHMEYKYMLGVLSAGLYDEFFSDIKTVFIPFLNPETYGRSTLENSSFLASSVNPDETVHGRGYVSRLSGSTTEVISIWIKMFMGEEIFSLRDGKLALCFAPKLPAWFFDENGVVSFNLLSKVRVTYHNESHRATYGENSARVTAIEYSGKVILGDVIIGADAYKIREGEILRIDVTLR